jgi:hypothetical protein
MIDFLSEKFILFLQIKNLLRPILGSQLSETWVSLLESCLELLSVSLALLKIAVHDLLPEIIFLKFLILFVSFHFQILNSLILRGYYLFFLFKNGFEISYLTF